ncbi:hypothetical protein Tco_0914202 [Tanacetum coccineum]
MDYDQLFEEFNVGAARQICLGSEVRSRTEHELELKEKLRAKYDARGVLLRDKDAKIARLKSLVKEKETESAEVLRLRDQSRDRRMSASAILNALDDSQAACGEARNLISPLSFERDGLASEVSTLHSAFRDFKENMEAQQEEQAQELYNRVAELEAHVMDVSVALEGKIYPCLPDVLPGDRWPGRKIMVCKGFGEPDMSMEVAGTPLPQSRHNNPETALSNYLDAIKSS